MFDIDIRQTLLLLPGIFVGLTFHEFAHGWVAYRLGDQTARLQGRLTLNPIAHLDPVGFIMLLLFHFGWAKPVPVNPYNLKIDSQKGMLYVSAAGPAANMIIAVALAVLLRLGIFSIIPELYSMVWLAVYINVVLAVFNLIPIPPLDGSKILAGFLPARNPVFYYLENYGFIILVLLLFTGVIGGILRVIINPIVAILLP
ncbi:MAG: site-2 protease family protein [Clostridiales bacterium]|nr:site-2 protease family protein [Clostridiales bacterium]MCF8021242.1 site-2 protease family protein [Clostridiales bacterium]